MQNTFNNPQGRRKGRFEQTNIWIIAPQILLGGQLMRWRGHYRGSSIYTSEKCREEAIKLNNKIVLYNYVNDIIDKIAHLLIPRNPNFS
jgi:hypothetical protein